MNLPDLDPEIKIKNLFVGGWGWPGAAAWGWPGAAAWGWPGLRHGVGRGCGMGLAGAAAWSWPGAVMEAGGRLEMGVPPHEHMFL